MRLFPLLVLLFLFASCSQDEPNNNNNNPSSSIPSSSSVSTNDNSSSSVVKPSSSSAVKSSSSKAVKPSSSSLAAIDTFTDSEGKVWMAQNLNIKTDNSKCYNKSEAKCSEYGRLYNWEDAKDVCPDGWRLPTKDEWSVIKDEWSVIADDFAALPGGYGNAEGEFGLEGQQGIWWTNKSYSNNDAYFLSMSFDDGKIDFSHDSKLDYYSVRCVQD